MKTNSCFGRAVAQIKRGPDYRDSTAAQKPLKTLGNYLLHTPFSTFPTRN